MIKSKRQMYIIISVFALMLFLGGTAYAWFNYRTEGSNNVLITGNIYLVLNEGTNGIALSNVFPETPEEARSHGNNFMTFDIEGVNESNRSLYYEIDLNRGDDKENKTRYRDEDLRFDLVELDANGNEVNYLLSNVGYDTLIDKRIWIDTIESSTSNEVTRKYKLRMWLSDEVLISDTDLNATYPATGYSNYYGNIKLSVIGDFTEKYFGYQLVKKSIIAKQNATSNSCNPVWVDDMGTQDESDDITYFSGTNDCVDMNYVWYSGKLWRITAIYPDGAMKLVSENNITSIQWGSSEEYDGSWIYQWLNEDFYDTLVNPSNIVDSTITWNYSTDNNSTPVRPESLATQKTKIAPVGLLNAYEYYNGYRCINNAACTGSSHGTGYLNIGYYWWLITPYSTSYVHTVDSSGFLSYFYLLSHSYSIRPSIVIKSGLEFTGDGTKTIPYEIVGDKEKAVNNTTLLSSRSIGEYVEFDNDLYRIVDTTDGITKLSRVDYLRDTNNNNQVIKKAYASSSYFGKSDNTQSDDYWDYYLNNTWYNSISTTYKNMLVDGTYYLGNNHINTHYKATVCKDSNLNNVTIANCTKYTSSDANKTFTGKVGLLRTGEMFSSQLGDGISISENMWTITPYNSSDVCIVNKYGVLNSPSYSSSDSGVRPTITLKSSIKITSGTGMENDPFEISE